MSKRMSRQEHVVICDRCRFAFKIQPRQRAVEGGGEEHFFTCPRCETEYLIARITARGVDLRAQMAVVRERLKTAIGAERATVLRQAQQIQWELEPEVTGAQG